MKAVKTGGKIKKNKFYTFVCSFPKPNLLFFGNKIIFGSLCGRKRTPFSHLRHKNWTFRISLFISLCARCLGTNNAPFHGIFCPIKDLSLQGKFHSGREDSAPFHICLYNSFFNNNIHWPIRLSSWLGTKCSRHILFICHDKFHKDKGRTQRFYINSAFVGTCSCPTWSSPIFYRSANATRVAWHRK